MAFTFDLISDLHIDTWPQFDWTQKPTSAYCVVAGDVARDTKTVIDTLRHLGQCYQAVFYVDGNDEHVYQYENLGHSYRELIKKIKRLPNVIFLQDNVVVIDDVAILGTNGWWTYDMVLGPALESEKGRLPLIFPLLIGLWAAWFVALLTPRDEQGFMPHEVRAKVPAQRPGWRRELTRVWSMIVLFQITFFLLNIAPPIIGRLFFGGPSLLVP